MEDVVGELVELNFKQKVAGHSACSEVGCHSGVLRPVGRFCQAILGDLDIGQGGEHAKVWNKEVQRDAEGPLSGVPLGLEDSVGEQEKVLEGDLEEEEEANQEGREEDLGQDEDGELVVGVHDPHGQPNDAKPHRDQGRKVVGQPVCVHGILWGIVRID